VALAEMHRTFNCGIGMVLIVDQGDAEAAMKFLGAKGETIYRLGEVRARQAGQEQTIIV
jgi:phosphoribosylformylglycinamidine cyclo-ligase